MEMFLRPPSAFTLIELLIVIAIIAILALVVIFALNPIELFRQARDSTRLSDFQTLNAALGIFVTDTGGSGSLGTASTTYISIPDPVATSSAGDQCQGLNLPATSTFAYHCASPQYYKRVDGTGWVPVNFNQISSKSPLGALPTDPSNDPSNGYYYAYTTDGNKYEFTAIMESVKQRSVFNLSPSNSLFPGVYEQGTSLNIAGLYNPSALIGYWNFDEGSGSSTVDQSGSGNSGAWNGTPSGSNGYYSAGKVGKWAGAFDGSSDYVFSANVGLDLNPAWSVALWADGPALQPANGGLWALGGSNDVQYDNAGDFILYWTTTLATAPIDNNKWDYWVATRNGSVFSFFKNGTLITTQSNSSTTNTNPFYVGMDAGLFYSGLVDDVRIYKRALSAAEVQAIYNAER
jgi:prepilin-type N-terminal cleavage/methylation domain-containing protein